MSPIRVLLADDHDLVRAGFRALLESFEGVQVVGEAADGRAALKLVETLKPDLVLMDIAMPELNGLEATALIARDSPQVRVLILSMHANEEYARRALRAGAQGYILKRASTAELELAVRAVARGEPYLTPAISKHLLADFARRSDAPSPLEQLSPRQREVLQLIAEGHSRKEIAEKLSISVKSFDVYRRQIMEQLGIEDTAGLVRFAIQNGLVHLDP
ncbi:MAG: response regulator [Acidobacteriota bacterium]